MDTVIIIVKIALSVAAGLIAGLSTIYVFNRIPAKWLCDYNEEPDKEMWGERIKKRPWNAVFSLVFIGAAVKMIEQGSLYQIAGVLTLWLLLLIGIADKKYMIIPDQFLIALAVTAIGFIPFQTSLYSPLYGALAGGGCFFLIGITGQIIVKKEAMGFGDVKMMAAIGLIAGFKGTVIILILTVFTSAVVLGLGLLAGRVKAGEEQPLGPFISACTALYIVFRSEIISVADLYIGIF